VNNLAALTKTLIETVVPIADIPPTLVRMGWTKRDAAAAVRAFQPPAPVDPVAKQRSEFLARRAELDARWEQVQRRKAGRAGAGPGESPAPKTWSMSVIRILRQL